MGATWSLFFRKKKATATTNAKKSKAAATMYHTLIPLSSESDPEPEPTPAALAEALSEVDEDEVLLAPVPVVLALVVLAPEVLAPEELTVEETMQSDSTAEPAALVLPASQSVHAAADNADALNLPAAQAATLEPEPVKPASALQSPSATDAASLPELSGHGVQDVALSTALSVSALYVPVMQFTQFAPLAFSPGPHSFTQSDSAFEAVPVVVLPVGQLNDGRFGSGGRSSSGRRRRR